jgi:hypothetical protein
VMKRCGSVRGVIGSGDVLRAAAGCQWGPLDSESDEQPL